MMSIRLNNLEKNKISYIHFLASVLVILIHSLNNETFFQSLFSIDKGIGQFAVPLFFMVSGFLFFLNVESIDDVVVKIRKRITTVVVPYLIWNFIYFALHLLFNPGIGFSYGIIVDAVFNYRYNPAFWFMEQLIIFIFLSPLIFYVTKKIKYCMALIVVIFLIILLNFDIPMINEDAFIYYVCGIILALFYIKGDMSIIIGARYKVTKSFLKYSLMFFMGGIVFWGLQVVALAFVNVLFKTPALYNMMTICMRAFFCFFIFFVADILFNYNKTYDFMKNTFFLYAIHYMIVRVIIKVTRFISIKYMGYEVGIAFEDIMFILSPVICIVANYYICKVLNDKFPKAYSILTGGRS